MHARTHNLKIRYVLGFLEEWVPSQSFYNLLINAIGCVADEGQSSQAGRTQEDEDGEDLQGRH